MEILLRFEVHLVLLLVQLLNALMIKHQGGYVFQKKIAINQYCTYSIWLQLSGEQELGRVFPRLKPFPAEGGSEGGYSQEGSSGPGGPVARSPGPRSGLLGRASTLFWCWEGPGPASATGPLHSPMLGECPSLSACSFLTCEMGI